MCENIQNYLNFNSYDKVYMKSAYLLVAVD